MSIERPKILSVITVPTGGWDIQIKLSNAAAYDVTVTATIPAGDYFVSGDAQTDDLLRALCVYVSTAIQLTVFNTGYLYAWIDSSHKVNLIFGNCTADVVNRPIKIVWTASDHEIPEALGFDYSADDIINTSPPKITADYHHAFGWYADGDGWLESKPLVDIVSAKMLQSRSLGGVVRTQQMSSFLYDSECSLKMIPNVNALSDGAKYGETQNYPASRNQPFECMWYEIVQGKRFRFYRNHTTGATRFDAIAVGTAYPGAGVITTGGMTHTVDRWNGRQIFNPGHSAVDALLGITTYFPYCNHITDTGSGNITTGLVSGIGNHNPQSNTFCLIDSTYTTYVLDASSAKFAPREVANLDMFDISLKMMRYIAP